MEAHLYKFRHTTGNAFNYFTAGVRGIVPPHPGHFCVDSMKIVDLTEDCITSMRRSIRKQDDLRVFRTGRFGVKLDRMNDARSELGLDITEFLAKDELKNRKIFFRFIYGPNIKYEGFIDLPSFEKDLTWTNNADDITFDVDDPMDELYISMKEVNLPDLPANERRSYDQYFASVHFKYWRDNGTVTNTIDGLKLEDKLGWRPIISGQLRRYLYNNGLNQGYKVYDGTLAFAKGLGISIKLESVWWNPYYEPMHTIPFQLTYFLETDGLAEVEVENLTVRKSGFSWYAKQHMIIPYWHMQAIPQPFPPFVEAYYFGLFMSSEGEIIVNNDYRMNREIVPLPIIKYNAGNNAGNYEIVGGHFFAYGIDVDLLDVGKHAQNNITINVGGVNYQIWPAYSRILVKDWEVEQIGEILIYRDEGFEEIIRATAAEFYKFNVGQFKEKLIISTDYPEDTSIDIGTVLVHEGKKYRVEEISSVNLKDEEVSLQAVEI